jgi:peptidoglycan hydrolase-like protein with peptidoglycan-binding domain
LLQRRGFLSKTSPVDGLFGKITEDAVRSLQMASGLVANGIVNQDTWKVLDPNAPPLNLNKPVLRLNDGIDSPQLQPDVKHLQTELKQKRFLPANAAIDGQFGNQTQQAVKAFQRAYFLVDDGIVGPSTWNALAKVNVPEPPEIKDRATLRQNSKELDDIMVLQIFLKLGNFLSVDSPIDGLFGSTVYEAVKTFQRSQNLVADGVVGPNTWQALRDYGLDFHRPGVSRYPILMIGDGQDYPELKDAVKALQTGLQKYRFLPQSAAIDGIFGPQTQTAVKSLQNNNNLVSDGLVAKGTWAKVQGKSNVNVYQPQRRAEINVNIQKILNAIPDGGMRRYAQVSIPLILKECETANVNDKGQIAYILATAQHESRLGQWMEEFASGRAYEGRRDLGNIRAGDGVKYKGRGFVQITGRRNYTDWSRRLGIDLVNNPQQAADQRIASKILVVGMRDGTFTGRGLKTYISGGKQDFYNARRIVNGMDRAALIAGYAKNFVRVL